MRVISRRPGETIVIDGRIRATVCEIRDGKVRLQIEGEDPASVSAPEPDAPHYATSPPPPAP